MKRYSIKESAVINAPAETVYEVIADYHNGHPYILPEKYFSNLEVLEGGYGAGTKVRFDMHVYGNTQTSEAVITEPEPGRVLVESIEESGVVTTFIVEPQGENQTKTTFETEMNEPAGLFAPLIRWVTKRYLRQVYQAELAQLDSFAQTYQRQADQPASTTA